MKTKYLSISVPMTIIFLVTGCGSTTNTSSNTDASYTSHTTSNQTSSSTSSSTPSWMHVNKDKKTVILDITADQTKDNNGFNFNGYSDGELTITVPLNWNVEVNFTNQSSMMPHSAEIVPFTQHLSSNGFTPAFTGSATPEPDAGIMSGKTQSFTFSPTQSGKYALVCAVPGHVNLGLWDNFDVSSNATVPFISTSTSTTTTSSSGNGY